MHSLWPFLLCLCVAKAVSAFPLESRTVAEDTEKCELREEALFCDFEDPSTAVVSLGTLDSKIKKVFIHNAKRLDIVGPNCVNLALYKIHEVAVSNPEENKDCENGIEFAAKESVLTSVPDQITNMYLEKCNVTNLMLKSSVTNLEVIYSVIDVLEISTPLKNGATVLFEKSLINSLRKLVLDYGAELTLKSTIVQSIDSKGLILNHGTVNFIESSFANVANDSIIILPAVTLNLEKYSGNIQVSGSTSSENNFFAGFIVCLVLLAIFILTLAFFLIYRKLRPEELNTKHRSKTNIQTMHTEPESASLLTQKSNTNDEEDKARKTSLWVSGSPNRDRAGGNKSRDLPEKKVEESNKKVEKESNTKKIDTIKVKKGTVKERASLFTKKQRGNQSKLPINSNNTDNHVRDKREQFDSKSQESVAKNKGKEMQAESVSKKAGSGNHVIEPAYIRKTTDSKIGSEKQSQEESEGQPVVPAGRVKDLVANFKSNHADKPLDVKTGDNVETKRPKSQPKPNDVRNTMYGKEWSGKDGCFDDVFKTKINNDPRAIKTSEKDAIEDKKERNFDDVYKRAITKGGEKKIMDNQKETASYNFKMGPSESRYDDVYTKMSHENKEAEEVQHDDEISKEFDALFENS